MATQTAAAAGPQQPDQPVTEHEARFLTGLRMLAAGIAGLLAGVALAVTAGRQSHSAAVPLVLLCVLIFLASALVLAGLTPSAPGQARVVQLFGRYRGTIRDSGLQWVNPFTRPDRGLHPDPQPRNRRRPRSTTPTATRSRSPPWSSGRSPIPPAPSTPSTTPRSSSPSRPRPPSGTSPPATPTPAAGKVSCRCATTPTRSPAGSPPRSPRGSRPPGCASSSRG